MRDTKGIKASSASQSTDSEDPRPAIDEYPEGIISGEWPESHSFLSYDDLRAYLESQIISEKVLGFPFLEISSKMFVTL